MSSTRRTRAAPAGQVALGLLLALLVTLAVVVTPTDAHAYPDVQCQVTVSSQDLESGQKLTFRGLSGRSLDWRLTFAGDTHTGTGTEFRTRFTAPEVTAQTTERLEVSARSTSAAVSGACQRTFDITVSPSGGAAGPSADDREQGVLPNTGGPRLPLLGLALLLLVAGAATARRARRGGRDA